METSDLTARQIFRQLQENPSRARFGFGQKAILVNIDLQKAYTRTDLFKTAYETDPNQLHYVNDLAGAFHHWAGLLSGLTSLLWRPEKTAVSGAPALIRQTPSRILNLVRSAPNLMIGFRLILSVM